MSDVRIVRVLDERKAAECEVLYREYGEWSAGQLAEDFGIVMSPADLETVHAEFREERPEFLGPRGRLYVGEVDNEIAGVGGLKPVTAEVCEIKRMFVRPGHRGSGIARRILGVLLSEAREIGYTTARLETMTYMREAQLLYRSVGFVEAEVFESEGSRFGIAQCEVFMSLSL
jgi:GNAT superfamily N-acetyltransferase